MNPFLIFKDLYKRIFFLFVVGAGIRAQRLKPVTGANAIIGKTGTSLSTLDPSGTVRVQGEIWNAESLSGRIEQGEPIQVRAIKNLRVTQRRLDAKKGISRTSLA